MRIKNIFVGLTIPMIAPITIAQGDLATEVIERNRPVERSGISLNELLNQNTEIIPSDLSRDNVGEIVTQLRMERDYLDALLERTQTLESLRSLYSDRLAGPSQRSSQVTSSIDSDQNFDSQDSSATDILRGSGSYMGTQQQGSGYEYQPRWAALDYTWSLGGDRVARVQWGSNFPTVRAGDVLPGGFKVISVHSDEIEIEKEGVYVRMNQDRVSIDALMRAVAEQRAKLEQ